MRARRSLGTDCLTEDPRSGRRPERRGSNEIDGPKEEAFEAASKPHELKESNRALEFDQDIDVALRAVFTAGE